MGSLHKNPFQKKAKCSEVFVCGGHGAYDNTRDALLKIDLHQARGKKILLKPNAGRIATPGKGVTTDPMVVAAAIDVFKDAGAVVAIGESPIVGVKVHDAFEATGIAAIARKRGCKMLDMNRRNHIEVKVPDGVAISTLKVCPEVYEHDVIVSIPVMKTHMHTGVSLAVKNMKGCLWRRSKVDFHMLPPVKGRIEKPIDIAIADMSGVLRPHISIIDGTVGMEGLGPSAGNAKPLDVVLTSADAFAADAVACRLMGMNADDVPHLRMGSERKSGIINLNDISVNPERWEQWISPFLPPPQNLSIEFPGIRIMDVNSCSACQSTLFLFLKRYRSILLDYMPSGQEVCIAIGKGHDQLPEETLCIGNCTSEIRNKGLYVKGCPPVSSEILKKICGKSSIDVLDGNCDVQE